MQHKMRPYLQWRGWFQNTSSGKLVLLIAVVCLVGFKTLLTGA
jgi:hypothetical protein